MIGKPMWKKITQTENDTPLPSVKTEGSIVLPVYNVLQLEE